jgi:hypothetical protein
MIDWLRVYCYHVWSFGDLGSARILIHWIVTDYGPWNIRTGNRDTRGLEGLQRTALEPGYTK